MFEGMKPFDITGLKRINSHQANTNVDIDGIEIIDTDLILKRKYQNHNMKFMTRKNRAIKMLEKLPEPGDVYTFLLSGSFDGWDMIASVLEMAAPVTISELYISTLGFNQATAGALLHMLDTGKIAKVWFLASCFMRDSDGDKFVALSDALIQRGHKVRGVRNHSKISAMLLSDGRKIVTDGSINLASSKNVEQAHMWADAELFDFYQKYIKTEAEKTNKVK